MSASEIRLSIIIPAYNEHTKILKSIATILAYVERRGIDAEVVVVDDGSKDDTSLLIEDMYSSNKRVRLLKNSRNMGKGFSVRRGMLEARGKTRLFTDADNSTPISEIRKFLPLIESGTCDLAIGSRSADGAIIKIAQSWYRSIMGKTFNIIVRALGISDFSDTQCGFKCFTADAAAKIFKLQKICGFAFDVEALAIAKACKFRVAEIPVVWVNRRESRVRPLTDAARMLVDLFILRADLARRNHLK